MPPQRGNAPVPSRFVVHGRIGDSVGNPLAAVVVTAFDKDLRTETALGRATTDGDGRYEIVYVLTPIAGDGQRLVNLLVRASDEAGRVLAESAVIFNAGPIETVNLTVDGGRPSEFESQLAAIRPSLGGIDITQLQNADLSFLAGVTSLPELHVAWLSVAHQHGKATNLPPEAFYGLFRQNLPTSLPALIIQSSRTLRASLERSVGANIIPAAVEPRLDDIVATLHGLVGASSTGGNLTATWSALIQLSGLPLQQQDMVLKSYVERTGTLRDFWAGLRKTEIGNRVDDVQAVLRLALMTDNNVPLVAALQAANVRSPQDLAALGEENLKRIIGSSDEILSDAREADARETRDASVGRYAGEILTIARSAFPTAFLRARLAAASGDPLRADTARVLAAAPAFELRDRSLDQLLTDHPHAMDGVANREGTIALLKQFQRVLRAAPSADHADALVSAGLDSARAIVSLAPQAFIDQFAELLGGSEQAQAYYAKAQQVSASVNGISVFAQSVNDILPHAIADPTSPKEMPSLTKLFGSYSFCACEDCRSVYSPAAYLVDLLQFLNPKAGQKPLPLDTLGERRPDIEHIPLTCENANTALPYVDLVNEILEFYISHGKLSEDAANDTGNSPSAELSVTPKYTIKEAYDKLQSAVYPPSLPFHRPLATTRMYLEHLGTTRGEVMRAFQHAGVPSAADIDLEYLNISAVERNILTVQDPHTLPEFYGYGENAAEPSWLPDVAHVSQFLQRTETNYDELLQLIDTRFVNSDAALKLQNQKTEDDCDLENVDIQSLTSLRLQRIHRFLRLARKLDWSIADLDLACSAFQQSDINLTFLQTLAAVQRLKKELGLPLTEVLSLSVDISPDLHARVFQNKTVHNPPDEDFELNQQGSELKNAGVAISLKIPALLAAFRLAADDLARLRADADLADEAATMSLARLSALYRRVVLTRALKLRVAEFVSLRTLAGVDPFLSPANVLEFVQLARSVNASWFSIPQLDYLYRHVSDPSAPLAPQPAAIEALKLELLDGLRKFAEENTATPDPTGELSRNFIRQTLSENLKLESTVTAVLLDEVIKSASDPAKPASSDFANLLGDGLKAMTSYRRLHKAAMLVNGFRMSDRELSYLAAHAADFAEFNLNKLPLDSGASAPDLFKQWERLRQLFALRDTLPQAEATLFDVFASANAAEAVTALKGASGWDPDEINFLIGPAGLKLSAGDFKNEIALVNLRRCLDLSARVGISCKKLFEWAGAEPGDAAAQEVVNAVKAKYDPVAWLRIAKPLNDALRNRRKSAILAYLLASDDMRKRNIRNEDQLFAFFLIDVEMEPCTMTSRIKQAISSVQLFIQQCLMNLEPNVSPLLIDSKRWEWMKNYRVWEANRKVFLYPENWIYPELRDDKTPFFKALETHLLQNDITAETAEDAFLSYLHDLDEVARLDIVGMYTQTVSEPGSSSTIVHVFGRTQATPPRHFYRRQVDGVWSAWEKIDVDIETDHLIPVVYDRRLYLFWPHFEERPDPKQELPAPYVQSLEHWHWEHAHDDWKGDHAAWAADPASYGAEPQEPDEPTYAAPAPALKHREIKLCWSEYRQGGWSAKQTSSDFVTSPFVTRTFHDYALDLSGGLGGLVLLGHSKNGLYPLSKGADSQGYVSSETLGTIVSVFVPEPNEHFFRTHVEQPSGDLWIHVYRRYEHTYRALDLDERAAKGYDWTGSFRLACGTKVRAYSLLSPKEFNSLVHPDGATNDAMAFRHESGKRSLSLTGAGSVLDVLDAIPAEADQYDLLPEHQFASFSLPTQNFFYQDDRRTYFAHYQPEPLPGLLSRPDEIVMSTAALDVDHALVREAKNKRSLALSPAVADMARGGLAEGPGHAPSDSTGVALETPAISTFSGIPSYAPLAVEKASFITFETFFHPHVCEFLKQLHRKGVPGLFAPPRKQPVDKTMEQSVQQLDNDASDKKKNVFLDLYQPSSLVSLAYPREHVDFDDGAYSIYNWELFVHAPLLLATSHANNHQFDDARTWLHYIFNPTNAVQPTPQGYWNTLPFYNNDPKKDRIQELLASLDATDAASKLTADRVRQQIEAWIHDPFNPHHIARMRITAYQKNVVMKYIDVLLQHGDQLFSRNTIESINEATLMYVLAHSILGPRPEPIAPHMKIDPKAYADLKDLDEFSNALVPFENELPYMPQSPSPDAAASASQSGPATFYFCIPPNSDMLRYWDTVEDRLFKIRHCMNIEG